MNTFSIVQRALDASALDTTKQGLPSGTIETGRILDAVQHVVNMLTPGDGRRYVVSFADIATAGTDLRERRILVSSKPLKDDSLTLVQKAVVIATFAAHEIGHTFVTLPRRDVIEQHNGHSGYHSISNLADDIILEPFMIERAPILEDAFTFTGLWVLRATAKQPLPKVHEITPDSTTAQRFNALLSATRYADIPDILFNNVAAIEDRDWGRDWALRLMALDLADQDGFLALCDEAWVRVRSTVEPEPEPEPEPQPPVITEPQEGGDDESDDGDDEKPEPDEGEGEGDDAEGDDEDGESEPTDEDGDDGESDDESDGDSESDTDDEGEGEGDDGDDATDDDATDESDGTDGEGESADFGDESDADGDPTTDDADGQPSDAIRPEDSLDSDDVDESMHNQTAPDRDDWWADREAEQAMRTYASTTVTAFGKHGKMTTHWD